MVSDEKKIDAVLDILSKPLSRYILSVLAGTDPGVVVKSEDNPKKSEKERSEEDS
jgi:hypothetical protein